jgi:hypothetical protein
MQARKSVTKARRNARAGKISEPNSSLDGRPGSIGTSHPTDGSPDGLREGGSSWLYFEGLCDEQMFVLQIFFMYHLT